jgi:hypothetical protein
MATELSTSTGWPETGFEEIASRFLEADFWPGIISGLPVKRPLDKRGTGWRQALGQPEATAIILLDWAKSDRI